MLLMIPLNAEVGKRRRWQDVGVATSLLGPALVLGSLEQDLGSTDVADCQRAQKWFISDL